MLDTNPVYNAPADSGFAAALARVPFTVSLALYPDETTQASLWAVPKAHEYETWSDARAFNGVATIQQPQILPLFGGRSVHEVLAILQGNTGPNPQDLVREHWRGWSERQGHGEFAPFWYEVLRAGTVPDTEAPRLPIPPARDVSPLSRQRLSRSRSASGCCSGPTRSSGTAASPTMRGCWSCPAHSRG